jgi:four helix bundle protein
VNSNQPIIIMFGFEKIEVWERAIEFADIVYSVTGRFPADERFDLTCKMRRASVSISSSIAEGSLRKSSHSFLHFIGIAAASLDEVVQLAAVSLKQGFLSLPEFQGLCATAEEQRQMLRELRRSLRGEP